MGFYENLETWQGFPVHDWTPKSKPLQSTTAYRLRLEWEDEFTWAELFGQFLEQPGVEAVPALLVGSWGALAEGEESLNDVIEALVGAREQLPSLRALFIGDVTSEESEISWITLGDVSPLFHAYPKLEHFAIRGGANLSLGVPRHDHLKSLAIETGGLSDTVLDEINLSQLPALEHLELYLGTANYGGTITPESLATILHQGPTKWPKLRSLGLRDYDQADALAAALVVGGGVPLLAQLETLDLSLGTLGNEGIEALAACPKIAQLKKLDLHHHYGSKETLAKLQALGMDVDASDPQDESKYGRFVAVGE